MPATRANTLTTSVLGLREAIAAFQRLPEVAKDAYNWATEVSLSAIARSASARLRANGNVRTGLLADHIGWSLNRATGQGKVGIEKVTTIMQLGARKVRVTGHIIAGAGGSALKSRGAKVIIPTKYGHLTEFNTGPGDTKPFMRPAVSQEESHYLARCRDAGKRIETDMAMVGGRNL